MSEVILYTGAELADHICAEASARGMLVSHFLLPVFPTNPAARLNTIRQAKAPTRITVDRVNEVLTEKVIMPTASNRGGTIEARRLVTATIKQSVPAKAEAEGTYVSRDPCFRCGTRADLGCRHQRPHHSVEGGIHV